MTAPGIAISLFDITGTMLHPWRDAGYDCYAVDVQQTDIDDGINHVVYDLSAPWLPPFDRSQIAFVSAFPPCDHLAVSGARWFRGKGLWALSWSINLFATAAEYCEWSGARYLIENPVSTISTYWRKPDHTLHPWHFSGLCQDDNYTKKTCLWTGGGFVMPEPVTDSALGPPEQVSARVRSRQHSQCNACRFRPCRVPG